MKNPFRSAPPPESVRTSTPRTRLEELAWPDLDEEVVDCFREHGEARTAAAGEVLFDVGEESYDLIYLDSGAVEIVDRTDDDTVVRIEAGNFVGELGMLMGQKTFLAGVAAEDCEMVVVPVETLRELVSTVPEVGDAVVTAFAARRRLLSEWGEGGLVLVGEDDDPAALRLREFASRSRIPHRWVDRADEEALAELEENCALPPEGAAAVVGHSVGNSRVLCDPTPRDVAAALGLDLAADADETFDVLVVGAGPAGLAASVYAASEGLSVLAIEDTAIGGQAGTSSRIENYLGFPGGIEGGELAYRGEVQAVKFGARITAPRRATALERDGDLFSVALDDERCVRGRAVILACGARYRRLPVPGIHRLEGRGIYYAATELEARFCRGSEAVVVGGGNSAGQAAMYLSRCASCTHVVVRGEGLEDSMSAYLSERLEKDENIELWMNTQVCRLHGEDRLEAVTLRRDDGEEKRIETQALFVMIGVEPNTAWLGDLVDLDPRGFVRTGGGGSDRQGRNIGFATSCPGVFAVGDVRSGSVKRVASAVGEGSVVIAAIHDYLRGDRTSSDGK